MDKRMGKILVVDDSEAVRIQITKDVEAAGHSVVAAVDGLDGLAKLKENSGISLILSDVNMPNMDGLTMCQNIRQLEEYKAIPIMMLTTETNEEMKMAAKNVGVRAWVRKPYVAQKLVAAIHALLQK
jgi:two-component system, chemotaxis family, chemotaxis protein CheY